MVHTDMQVRPLAQHVAGDTAVSTSPIWCKWCDPRNTPEGTISTAIVLIPKTTYYITAYLNFQGTALNGDKINGRITMRVYVTVEG